MGNLGFTFDPNEVPEEKFDLIPYGTGAPMVIIETSVTHKDENGNKLDPEHVAFAVKSRMEFKVEILDGPFMGRFVWGGMNFRNPTPKAQTIGQQEMAAAFTVTGQQPSDNSEVLHNIPFWGVIKITTDTKGPRKGQQRNDVNWRLCKHIDAMPGAQQTRQAAAPATQRSAASTQQQSPPAQERPAAPPPQQQVAGAPAGKLPWTNRRSG